MKYGINFGHKPIEEVDHKMPRTLRTDGTVWRLEGLCTTDEEAQQMLIQASNGRRRLQMQRKGDYIGIYVA